MKGACQHCMLQPGCGITDPLLQEGIPNKIRACSLINPSLLVGMGVALALTRLAYLHGSGEQYLMPTMPMASAPSATALSMLAEQHLANRALSRHSLPRRPALTSFDGAGHFHSAQKAVPWMRGVRASAESDKENKGGFFGFNFNEFGNELNKAVDYFADGGRRKKRWTKDFRPESERGIAAGPSETSQLSWGGAKSRAAYAEMCEQFDMESSQRAASRLENQPMGSAGSAILGESSKASSDVDSDVYENALLAEVPLEEDEVNIDSPVELAELIRGKYGRYYDVMVRKSKDALNEGTVILFIYSAFLGSPSFPYTEEQWLKKLNNIVILLSDLDQAWYVKKYLLSKAQGSATILGARMSRPTTDKALTFRLSDSPTWKEPEGTNIFDTWLMMQSYGGEMTAEYGSRD
eukprot:gnl/MRDRNA2_/MRDRNA2_179239_c0_seq1.p1 gnl/MRDRNA2_/MRDRNA2_179239_c0~~gnl/MRDRNA2_/MRDRNA2_179239_c0_seq1.p1  ORF type:complete len:408 (+),score=66.60 gnl/MRDRNA2_/MRDRNA2_179239_c0_seq1:46-1269(+)